jgi:tetratricopeptide (TPR) repeat protein
MTLRRAWLAGCITALVGTLSLHGEELPLRFADDFGKDSRKEYEIKGDVSWEKGRLLLGGGTEVHRTLELGHRVQMSASLAPRAGKGPTTLFVGLGDKKIRLFVGVRWAEEQVSLVWPAQPPEVVPLAAAAKPAAAGSWEVRLEMDHGLVRWKAWARGQEEPPAWQMVRYLDGTDTLQAEWIAVGMQEGVTALARWEVRSTRARRWTAEQRQQLEEAHRCGQEMLRLYREGQIPAAERKARQVVDIYREVLPPTDPSLATAVNNLGMLLQRMGKYGEARSLYEEALQIYRKGLPPDHPGLGPAINNLGMLLKALGKRAEARPLLEEALRIRRRALPQAHSDVALSASNLGQLLQDLGQFAEAQRLLEEAVQTYRKTLPPAHPDLATSLNNLASLLQVMGKPREARLVYEEALKSFRKALPPTHPFLATCLNNLGQVLHDMGEYAEARPLLEEAVEINRKTTPPNHTNLASSLNSLGSLLRAMGRHSQAQPLLEEAVQIYRRTMPPNPAELARSINNLGLLLQDMRKYAAARQLLEEAVAIQRAALSPNHPDLATCLNNLGALLHRMGKPAEARQQYEEALKIFRKVFPPTHPRLADNLDNLGSVLHDLGEYRAARLLYEEALQIRRTALPPRHPAVAISINNLGGLLQEMGESRASFDLLGEAVRSWAGHAQAIAGTSAQADHAAFIQQKRRLLDVFLSQAALALATEDARWSEVLQAVLDSKGISTNALATRRDAILTGNDPHAQRVLRQLLPKRQELADLLLRGASRFSPQDYRDRCQQLGRDCDNLERELGALSHAYAEERYARRAGLADLAARLPADAVDIEFLRSDRFDFKAQRWDDIPRYLALVLHRGEKAGAAPEVRFVDLGEIRAIDTAIDAWQAAVRKGRRDETAERRLGELLWAPLVKVLREKKRLFLAPDGQLAILPFEALRLDDGRFLIEEYHVSYLNSCRDVMPRPQPPEKPDVAVVLADPDYEATSDNEPVSKPAAVAAAGDVPRDLVFGGTAPRRLPGFAREADAAAKLLEARRGWREVHLRSASATEEALQKVGRCRLLYCITHGFFLPDAARPAPEKGTRELGLAGPSLQRSPLLDLGPDPRLRSGLVLAGANRWQERVKKGLSDGLLTALEVEQLDLWGTELVILSACDTGRGEVQIGEGVLGLRRAFQLAGAECVLASLWPVEDKATELLLQDFLRRWLDGKPPASALREAQLAAIAGLRKSKNKRLAEASPLLWAGFICHGRSE